MSLIPERLPAGPGRALSAIGLDPALPALRRDEHGGIDYDWYLLRARKLRAKAYARTMPALWRGLGAAARSPIKAFLDWRARERAITELLRLDERALRDLGLNRAGVFFAVDHGREDLPVTANTNSTAARPPEAA